MLCMGPLAAVAIALLDAAGLVAPEPIWLIPVIIVVGQIMCTIVDLVWRSSPTRGWLHARVAAQAIVVTLTIYLTGWGPGLAVGLLLVGQESLTAAGSGSERVVLGWNLSALAAGELLLALGVFPSLLPVPEVHGLALLMGVGIAFSYRSLATALREKELNAELIESRERRFRSLVQNAHDLVFVVDVTASVTYASPSCSEVLGYEPGALLGSEAGSLIHADDIDTLRELVVEMRATDQPTCEFAIRVRRRDGALRWLEGLATDLIDDPSVSGLVINARDVTERRVREERQAVVSRLGREALGSTSLEELLRDAAGAIVRVLSVHECRIVGMLDDRKKRVHAFAVDADGGAGAAGTRKSGLETVRVPIGEPQHPLAHIEVVTDRPLTSGSVSFLEAIAGLLLSSIARSRAEEAIRHQALHDPLTGLPNRTLLNDRLEQTIVRARNGTPRPSRSSSWTSTASRRSTTRSATR